MAFKLGMTADLCMTYIIHAHALFEDLKFCVRANLPRERGHCTDLFPLQGFYTSSPPFIYRHARGVQPAKREEDWGRGLLGCVAIRCA